MRESEANPNPSPNPSPAPGDRFENGAGDRTCPDALRITFYVALQSRPTLFPVTRFPLRVLRSHPVSESRRMEYGFPWGSKQYAVIQ